LTIHHFSIKTTYIHALTTSSVDTSGWLSLKCKNQEQKKGQKGYSHENNLTI
jgi:hypothetical protein